MNIFSTLSNTATRIKSGIKNENNRFIAAQPKPGNVFLDPKKQPLTNLGYSMSGGTDNVMQDLHDDLQRRNLPGQVITGELARQRAADPQFQVNQRLKQGNVSVSPQEIGRTNQVALNTVIGSVTPMKSKVPRIDPNTQQEMMNFIDYVRLKQPQHLPTELGATRIAENYGLRMPNNRTGLANEFDRVLSLIRQKAR